MSFLIDGGANAGAVGGVCTAGAVCPTGTVQPLGNPVPQNRKTFDRAVKRRAARALRQKQGEPEMGEGDPTNSKVVLVGVWGARVRRPELEMLRVVADPLVAQSGVKAALRCLPDFHLGWCKGVEGPDRVDGGGLLVHQGQGLRRALVAFGGACQVLALTSRQELGAGGCRPVSVDTSTLAP